MKQEDKDLLLKDLSTRLPYHVKVKVWLKDGTTEEGPLDLEHNYGDVLQDAFYYNEIKDIKPYLRPMSSMTEEEKAELSNIVERSDSEMDDTTMKNGFIIGIALGSSAVIDYLLSKHFDFRGLIPKNLAIEVTKDNNPYKS